MRIRSGYLCVRLELRRLRHSFVTTPIFYVNAAPHLGHLYSAVLADATHRWENLRAPEDHHLFSTGTDEHGSKIQKAALEKNVLPSAHCQDVSGSFRRLFDQFDISYTDYIRTTEDRHKQTVQTVWKRLADAGLIYKGTYGGWYSIVDECFYTDGEVTKTRDTAKNEITIAKETKAPVEWVEETNYMFRLSELRESTRKILEGNLIQPDHYKSLALQELSISRDDLSVSRDSSRLQWGIPVPDDPQQTIYVWLDALTNYLTVNGYPDAMQLPAPTCQIIGKEIVRFHTVYWLAFLQALKLPIPEKIFVHGHWLVDGVKMSKSVGNVVDPLDLGKTLGSDGVRFFLLSRGVLRDNCNFSKNNAVHLLNGVFAKIIGSLLKRATYAGWNERQVYPVYSSPPEKCARDVQELIGDLNAIRGSVEQQYDQLRFYEGIEQVTQLLKRAARTMESAQLMKEPDERKVSFENFFCSTR
ncbi:unnamed protein product, partial [Mesorhabditis spiculigera]